MPDPYVHSYSSRSSAFRVMNVAIFTTRNLSASASASLVLTRRPVLSIYAYWLFVYCLATLLVLVLEL